MSTTAQKSEDSCRTAQLPDFIQPRKKKSRQKSRQKTDEFLQKLQKQPLSIQKSMIAAEISKIEKMCSRLTSTNAQHFITKKKLQKRIEFLQNYISKMHSPSAKTAFSVPDYFDIPTPTTAMSPVLEKMEERIDQIKIHLKSRQIAMEDFEVIKEKILIEQTILRRYEKDVDGMGKELKEFEERMTKYMKARDKLIKAVQECEDEHLKIKNDFKLYEPKIVEMNKKVKEMQKLIHRCDGVTRKLNSGESRLSWELWVLSPFYNFILWFLFVCSLLRDEATKFFAVFMKDFKQKRLKK